MFTPGNLPFYPCYGYNCRAAGLQGRTRLITLTTFLACGTSVPLLLLAGSDYIIIPSQSLMGVWRLVVEELPHNPQCWLVGPRITRLLRHITQFSCRLSLRGCKSAPLLMIFYHSANFARKTWCQLEFLGMFRHMATFACAHFCRKVPIYF